MIKAIIVEDERKARETLKALIDEYCEGVEVIALCNDVKSGLKEINQTKPDLVFLDIEMQTGSGFDLLNQVEYKAFDVIFTTAYEHYAIKAIKANAIDYLLKPIDWEELKEAVEKIITKRGRHEPNDSFEHLIHNLELIEQEHRTITLATQDKLQFVKVNTIIRCQAAGAYTTFYFSDGKHIMVSKNIKSYEDVLAPMGFFRVHHSHLINLNHLKQYQRGQKSEVLLSDGSKVDVSYRRKEQFLEAIKNWK